MFTFKILIVLEKEFDNYSYVCINNPIYFYVEGISARKNHSLLFLCTWWIHKRSKLYEKQSLEANKVV
jgi:hypothetical protein